VAVAWVLGSSGLLGTAICGQLQSAGTTLFSQPVQLAWGTDKFESQICAMVGAFAEQARLSGEWEIYWAAGKGAMGSPAVELEKETQSLARFLQAILEDPYLTTAPGRIAFASSAGSIYGGTTSGFIGEVTVPTPGTAYAFTKLKQESLLSEFLARAPMIAGLVARVSTIYGVGQDRTKQQGLITHIARSIIHNRPIQIFVPFDTIRDYIAADDAALTMIASLRELGPHCVGTATLKIVAAERPTTIAEIISIFKHISRRAPLVVTSASPLSALYTRRIQFKSEVLPHCQFGAKTSLAIGIAKVLAAERSAYGANL